MRFQLVLQFKAPDLAAYDVVVELEDDLIVVLGDEAEVDGHDFGSGEMNIFIHTDAPCRCFEMSSGSISPCDSIARRRIP